MAQLLVADRLPRVQRLTGLPVASVEWVPLRPGQEGSPGALLVRLDDGQAAIVPAPEAAWQRAAAILRRLGMRRPVNPTLGRRLMRALLEAAQPASYGYAEKRGPAPPEAKNG